MVEEEGGRMIRETVEFTTQIGCGVACLKYCPQEIITAEYKGERRLTVDAFGRMIESIPDHIPVIFGGVSEPFQNQETPSMMMIAHIMDHPIIVYSTLSGLTAVNAERISKIPFEKFVIHMPDAYQISRIPATPDYKDSLAIITRSIENIAYMHMGKGFVSDLHERRIRGQPHQVIKGRVGCYRHTYPNLYVMPNGDAYFCCQTKGVTDKIGNLLEESYAEITAPGRFGKKSNEMQYNPDSICHKCTYGKPYWQYVLKEKFGNQLIDIGKRYFI